MLVYHTREDATGKAKMLTTRAVIKAQGKHTPNVRKILQSQKTFANHLDDFLALQAQSEGTAGPSSKRPVPANRGQDDNAIPDAMKIKPPTNKKNVIVRPSDILTPFRHPFASNGGSGSENSAAQDDGGKATNNSSHDDSSRSSDNNPLLASRVPPLPTDDELRALLEHPPLSYGEARGTWDDEARRRYPGRVFCEVCGYWGRVRCTKCGTRVCALQCLETHRAECVTRYGL
jgi:zinc finger HIT domain-containing protein 1